MNNSKVCNRCNIQQPKKNFNKNSSHKDGLDYRCRTCVSKETKKRMQLPGYVSFINAKNRCNSKSYEYYKNYGGKGITTDDTFNTYKTFWQAYGKIYEQAKKKYPGLKLEIDRIDNDGNYERGNIRFVPREVNQNNKSTNIKITIDGIEKTLAGWCNFYNTSYYVAYRRYKKGWDTEFLFLNLNQNESRKLTKYFNNK